MKRIWVFLLFLSSPVLIASSAQDDTAKGQGNWESFQTPEEAGFSSGRLEAAGTYWETLRPDAGAVIVVYKGKILIAWGETTYKFMCHSVRKSFLNALYGIHVSEGNIDLDKTMAELGIDDEPPLTEEEKQARVIHLLMSRSGVYHEAAAEAPEMKATRPQRGSHAPGTFWYYNNWDFNVLGTIFVQETGEDIFQEFKERIADPIGMQDFETGDGQYQYELQYSIHPAYPFRMTARDRARFGQLFLQEGRWGDKQIIPKNWIKDSLKAYSDASQGVDPEAEGVGYGYLWWIIDERLLNALPFEGKNHLRGYKGFTACGYRGHLITVIPDAEIVFVMCVNTDLGVENVLVTTLESFTLLNMVLDAKEFEIIDLAAAKTWSRKKAASAGDDIDLFAKIENLSKAKSGKTSVEFYLSRNGKLGAEDVLLGKAVLPRIKAGKKKKIRLGASISDDLPPGSYYLIAYVDKEDQLKDPHTGNNIGISKTRIEIR